MESLFFGFVFACGVAALISGCLGLIIYALSKTKHPDKAQGKPVFIGLAGIMTSCAILFAVSGRYINSVSGPQWWIIAGLVFALCVVCVVTVMRLPYSRKSRTVASA